MNRIGNPQQAVLPAKSVTVERRHVHPGQLSGESFFESVEADIFDQRPQKVLDRSSALVLKSLSSKMLVDLSKVLLIAFHMVICL